MQKIDLVKFLVGEIKDEQAKFSRYKAEEKLAYKKACVRGKEMWECREWDEPLPKKSRISDNCKMARRLLLEIEQEEKSC